jgi:hypothetical protein
MIKRAISKNSMSYVLNKKQRKKQINKFIKIKKHIIKDD